MELTGKIRLIEDTQTFKSNFKKRVLILTTDDKYPQHISIEFLQDNTNLLDKLNIEDPVTIGINIRGKEWIDREGVTKYFNSIVGWRIERINDDNNSSVDIPAPPNFDLDLEEDEDPDLPF